MKQLIIIVIGIITLIVFTIFQCSDQKEVHNWDVKSKLHPFYTKQSLYVKNLCDKYGAEILFHNNYCYVIRKGNTVFQIYDQTERVLVGKCKLRPHYKGRRSVEYKCDETIIVESTLKNILPKILKEIK